MPTPRPRPPVVTGVTLDSRAVRPGDLYAALPGVARARRRLRRRGGRAPARSRCSPTRPARPRPSRPACRVRRRRPAGRARARSRPGSTATRPARLHAGRRHRHQRQDDDGLPARGRAARPAGRRTGLIGTVETRIGDDVVPERAHDAGGARPAGAARRRCASAASTAVAMEVSSHALALGRVDGDAFDVARVHQPQPRTTSTSTPTMEEYFAAKAPLFTPARSRRGVVDVDDPYGRRLVELRRPCRLTTVSPSGADADWRRRGRRGRAAAGSTFALRRARRRDVLDCGTRAARRRSTSPTPRSPSWPLVAAGRRPGSPRRPASRTARRARAGWSGSTTGPAVPRRSSTTRTRPTPWSGCSPRRAAWSPTAAGWSWCSAAAATATGTSGR